MLNPQTADDTIYLDHAATTPVDAEVLSVMLPFFSEQYGNPSSIYRLGQDARAALDRARGSIARVLGCQADEILFTSGATESNNLALVGMLRPARAAAAASHIVTTTIEHHAVLSAAEALEVEGVAVSYVRCDSEGLVSAADVMAAVRPETRLISVMMANNEVGAIQPIAEIGAVAKARGIPFHTDAVQAAGTLPPRVDDLGVDLLSLSAHKFYGPKGVGVLYIRRKTPIAYQQHGGGQEGGRRGGTENVPLIVGMAAALEKADWLRDAYVTRCQGLRDRLWSRIQEAIPDATLNGPRDPERRLPNNLNIAIPGVQGETILLGLDMEGVAASAGSACTTGNSEPSHVLRAMGLSDEHCRASLRFTVGRDNTVEQMDEAAEILAETVSRVRSLAGVA
ncbi:MAG: cysteine desulfurase [Chloroflexia bacterium]|nr:cysteine desulfurase [Chloroflexia bacterium]